MREMANTSSAYAFYILWDQLPCVSIPNPKKRDEGRNWAGRDDR
jgi:hypothetical protein